MKPRAVSSRTAPKERKRMPSQLAATQRVGGFEGEDGGSVVHVAGADAAFIEPFGG